MRKRQIFLTLALAPALVAGAEAGMTTIKSPTPPTSLADNTNTNSSTNKRKGTPPRNPFGNSSGNQNSNKHKPAFKAGKEEQQDTGNKNKNKRRPRPLSRKKKNPKGA